MTLTKLGIQQLRIIETLSIEPATHFNVIYGANASGKTTLLDAIHILATARSFRNPHLSETIQYKQDFMRITAQVNQSSQRTIPLGIERNREKLLIKAEGQAVHKVSTLAHYLPLQLIQPNSHALIDGGPKQRRQFLDWGVFHVEPDFLTCWQRYRQALKQRNAALKQQSPKHSVQVWNPILQEMAERIDFFRSVYIKDLLTVLPQFTAAMVGEYVCSIDYRQGWSQAAPLLDILKQQFERDRILGFTQYGAHRADLVFQINEHKAQTFLSRGQQKMLVLALYLAQSQLLYQKTGRKPVILLDDLFAELDHAHALRLLDLLKGLPAQFFITVLDKTIADWHQWPNLKMFHMEHGNVMV